MRLLDYCGSKLAISAPDDPRSRKQPGRSAGKPGHNGRTGRPSRAAARMTRDHSGQRHPRTRQKNRQDAKPTARGTTTRPGRATRKPTRPCRCPRGRSVARNGPELPDRRLAKFTHFHRRAHADLVILDSRGKAVGRRRELLGDLKDDVRCHVAAAQGDEHRTLGRRELGQRHRACGPGPR